MFDSFLISLGIGSPASIGYLVTFGLKPAAVPGCVTLGDTLIGAVTLSNAAIGSATLSNAAIGSATLTEKQCTL